VEGLERGPGCQQAISAVFVEAGKGLEQTIVALDQDHRIRAYASERISVAVDLSMRQGHFSRQLADRAQLAGTTELV